MHACIHAFKHACMHNIQTYRQKDRQTDKSTHNRSHVHHTYMYEYMHRVERYNAAHGSAAANALEIYAPLHLHILQIGTSMQASCSFRISSCQQSFWVNSFRSWTTLAWTGSAKQRQAGMLSLYLQAFAHLCGPFPNAAPCDVDDSLFPIKLDVQPAIPMQE